METKAPRKVVRLVATAKHMYDGRALRAGDEFEADEVGAEEEVVANMARRTDEPMKRTYKRRDMSAEK